MKMFSLFLVKLRIKSFRVPELFIEIPETATVSSLKVWLGRTTLPVSACMFKVMINKSFVQVLYYNL